jgi:hypothetical protein
MKNTVRTSPAEPREVDLVTSMTEVVAERGSATGEVGRIPGVLVGRLVAVSAAGDPHVEFEGSPAGAAVPARSTVRLAGTDLGRRAVLFFEAADPKRPILVGLLEERTPEDRPRIEVEAEGDRLVLAAPKEIVLRTGRSSITLTRAGKVLIRGEYVVSRSTGVNRIRGGSVQIN